jgi:hypothetical protein
MIEFDRVEAHVAGALGISRDHIRYLRKTFLKEGEHWAYVKKRVMLSASALSILAQKKALPYPTTEFSEKAQGEAVAAQRLLLPAPFKGTLVAWSSPKNTRILLAYFPGTDPNNRLNLVRVRVRDNQNFVRGMEFKARHINEDLYDLEGSCPRWRGKF